MPDLEAKVRLDVPQGPRWVAVPSMVIIGVALRLTPLTQTLRASTSAWRYPRPDTVTGSSSTRLGAVVQLLGRPQVVHGEQCIALPAERRCQLLVHLALRRDWVPRAELATLLWPELPRPRALANLRKALHHAHALRWASALESQPSSVRFAVDTDLQAIENASRQGRIAQAVEMRGAVLLDGMDDPSNPAWTEWLDTERAQQQRRRHELTRACLARLSGDPAAAAGLARRLLDADPLDEDAVVALLAAQRELREFDAQRDTYRAYALRLVEELGVEPSQRVVGQLRASAAAAGNGFVGRRRELHELQSLLARADCRLLTVVGPGGVGKSSLVKQALKPLERRFADGALWIALDDLSDPTQALARLADELKLTRFPQQDALQQVCERLGPRNALLVFDNAEHLDGIAKLIGRLLDAAPALKICATSRTRLAVAGEWLLGLQGLGLPPGRSSADALLASDAGRLFIDAATAAKPDFDGRAQAGAVAELLHAVGGLPLAILLAAHWVRLLPVAEILAELQRSLAVLDRGDEGEERPEHRSVLATFERSWQMLATREQQVLAALSVFVGSFSREAAREVADASLPLLAALADKSLLQMQADGRCALHPLIRQFAQERLDAPTTAQAQRRHAQHFHRLLARLSAAATAADQAALDTIGADLENCRAAWRWAVAHEAAHDIAGSAVALKEYFNVRGRAAEGLDLLNEARAIASAAQPAAGAVLMSALAQTQYRLARLDDAASSARQGIRFARASGQRAALVRCLSVLGTCCWQWGRHHEAQRLLQQAVRQAGMNADAHGADLATHNLALVEKSLGNNDRAAELMCDWLVSQRAQGEWLRVAMGLSNLAYVYQAMGEWSLAQRCLDEGLALCDAHDLALPRPALLANLAHNHAAAGRLDEAEQVSRQLVREAGAARLSDVEATALNQLVRVAILRGDFQAARQRLADAIRKAAEVRIEYVEIDCVLSFARILAAERRPRAAAPLLRYLLARHDLEPVDRAQAEACLQALPAQSRKLPAPDLGLSALVQRIAAEVASPPAAA